MLLWDSRKSPQLKPYLTQECKSISISTFNITLWCRLNSVSYVSKAAKHCRVSWQRAEGLTFVLMNANKIKWTRVTWSLLYLQCTELLGNNFSEKQLRWHKVLQQAANSYHLPNIKCTTRHRVLMTTTWWQCTYINSWLPGYSVKVSGCREMFLFLGF